MSSPPVRAASAEPYKYRDTRELVALVNDAALLVQSKGEAAFGDLRQAGSRWRKDDHYVFVIDPQGNMLVHPEPALEGKNELGLRDLNGRPIIRGLIQAATGNPGRSQGWYHYQWPVPGGILPRWKSSFVRWVESPSGKRYIVGSGIYNDRMERQFVEDLVEDAAALIEKRGKDAFAELRDPKSRFVAKDAYVFVVDEKGVELVNPAFPNLEGRNVLDVRDVQGKPLVREMFKRVSERGSGWVEYMWPKPGESRSTQKSTYVRRATINGNSYLVGAGVYLADAPRGRGKVAAMDAPELIRLVRDGASLLEKKGEAAYPDFRQRSSKWFHDGVYLFVWSLDGKRVFHAADPSIEGEFAADAKDVLGRPYGKMFLEAAATPSGEGWVHYMYPEPGKIFPAWKSTYIKRVRFPSGKQYLVGGGEYSMQLSRSMVVDLVSRASELIVREGRRAFDRLRDKTGPFFFLETYVFVDQPDGTELVNPAQPSLEGRSLSDLRDVQGKALARDYIDLAMKNGEGWIDYYWYKPGDNKVARKRSYVRKVRFGDETFIVGSGIYED